MTRRGCEREFEAVQALRRGFSTPELREHVAGCAICSQAHAVAQAMLQTASKVSEQIEPAPASVIWQRAEQRRKEMALKQAMRPLLLMRVLAVISGLCSAGWILHFLPFVTFLELVPRSSVLPDEATCFAAAIAVLSIAIGAGYLLHDSRRSGERAPST